MLSWQVFLFALGVIGLGAVGYHLVHLRAIRYLQSASSEQDRLFGHFRALTDGAKELRLHRRKSRVFMDRVLGESVEGVRRLRTRGMSLFVISTSWGQFLMYAFIGLVLFGLADDGPNQTQIMTGFALVFVFMVTPLEGLLINIPRINMARVAASRIDEITREMPQGQEKQTSPPVPDFQRLELRDVTHQPASGAAASGSGRITATMDGAIIDVLVQAGQAVKQGDTLVILEAMKMEHPVKADRDGTVGEILATKGDQVKRSQLLVEITVTDATSEEAGQ
jgi:ABC-type siderophore export system fused ATPase/permease subunit